MLRSQALTVLNEKIAACTRCQELTEYRCSNGYLTVPGAGNPNARVFVIGEAPGQNEAEQGLPFVGRAGKLLTNILRSIGLSREEVFIGNTLKCRPPNNRDPQPDEAGNCRSFLDLQIQVVNPEWVLCLGRIASVYFLGLEEGATISELRGKIYPCGGRKVICTYHPSFLLRKPEFKADVWQDLRPLVCALQGPRIDV